MQAGSSNDDELQYLNQVKEIMAKGTESTDRTGTGTISLFGMQSRYSLRDNTLPLITSKRTFFRGIAEELLWFISGSTDALKLSARGVHIWDANGTKEFLAKRGFPDRREGDLGPIYGFQKVLSEFVHPIRIAVGSNEKIIEWRHFGAKYEGPDADYSGKGKDQLAEVIKLIKEQPDSRRIILSAWNAADIEEMALPPCHSLVQFYVRNGELSSQLYQRSADMGLGVPFNIASYALLTHLIAHVTGLKAAEFVHTIGDAHIYKNHIDPLKVQLSRTPFPFPKLILDPAVKNIDDFRVEHIRVEGYKHHDKIEMSMAV